MEGAAVHHHRGVADQAVTHRVDHHVEQAPDDHGGAWLARGGPLDSKLLVSTSKIQSEPSRLVMVLMMLP